MRGRPKKALVLTPAELTDLQALESRPGTSPGVVMRVRIVLACAQGVDNRVVAERLEVSRQTVSKWRARFVRERTQGLLDAPRSGAPRTIEDERVETVVAKTLEAIAQGSSSWTSRRMAAAAGLSQTAVSRIWRACSLQPHRRAAFKLSADPGFGIHVCEIAGLYVSSPVSVIALWVTPHPARVSISGEAFAGPGRPWRQERTERDLLCSSVTEATALLDRFQAGVPPVPSRRHLRDMLRGARMLEASAPPTYEIHVIVSHFGVMSPGALRRWHDVAPRLRMHFPPTPEAWLQQVGVWSSTLVQRALLCGTASPTAALERALQDWLASTGHGPLSAFSWTKAKEDSPGRS